MLETKERQYQGMVEQAGESGSRIVRPDDQLRLERRSQAADLHAVALQVRRQDAGGPRARARDRLRRRLRHAHRAPGGRTRSRPPTSIRVFIEDVKARMNPRWAFDAFVHDMLSGPGSRRALRRHLRARRARAHPACRRARVPVEHRRLAGAARRRHPRHALARSRRPMPRPTPRRAMSIASPCRISSVSCRSTSTPSSASA